MLPVGDGIKGNGRGFPYIPQQHAQICASVSVERQVHERASCNDGGTTPAGAWAGEGATQQTFRRETELEALLPGMQNS